VFVLRPGAGGIQSSALQRMPRERWSIVRGVVKKWVEGTKGLGTWHRGKKAFKTTNKSRRQLEGKKLGFQKQNASGGVERKNKAKMEAYPGKGGTEER